MPTRPKVESESWIIERGLGAKLQYSSYFNMQLVHEILYIRAAMWGFGFSPAPNGPSDLARSQRHFQILWPELGLRFPTLSIPTRPWLREHHS
ncbi:unnamed protein product [Macrosiphum euphorbiae]|uniref:Uncharacterized protein n=1 Tax=Macrosiphum euphorbiae TaxID=13131 RepID=A0AAV0XGF6_9HEMI|nr:unnamed protein product [Macrosiphum euphorbiae]